jgi:hypothetical protein
MTLLQMALYCKWRYIANDAILQCANCKWRYIANGAYCKWRYMQMALYCKWRYMQMRYIANVAIL